MFRPTLLLLSLLAVLISGENWPHVRTTWTFTPGISGFTPRPRIQSDAEYEGFIAVAECGDEHSMVEGNRYINAKPEDGQDFVLIFDKNGYIAGIQSLVPADLADDSPFFDFAQSEFYYKENILGKEVYVATAYFVNPLSICTVGRTEDQFEEQGTGYMLAFKRGDSFLNIALDQDDALQDGRWYQHKCFLNMGNHYFTLYYELHQDCQTVFPFQVVYTRGKLNAFVFQHQVFVPGIDWEYPDQTAINLIVDRPPQCLIDAADANQLTTMHVYVSDFIVLCLTDE